MNWKILPNQCRFFGLRQLIEICILFFFLFYSDLENQVANALNELQVNTIEMERNRVIPELAGLYNAENAAHELLPHTKFLTKLIGVENKRVITAFNPSESIHFNALNAPETNVLSDASANGLALADNEPGNRPNLNEPLQWDRNWMWDY